jgi:hypothetical protein
MSEFNLALFLNSLVIPHLVKINFGVLWWFKINLGVLGGSK